MVERDRSIRLDAQTLQRQPLGDFYSAVLKIQRLIGFKIYDQATSNFPSNRSVAPLKNIIVLFTMTWSLAYSTCLYVHVVACNTMVFESCQYIVIMPDIMYLHLDHLKKAPNHR